MNKVRFEYAALTNYTRVESAMAYELRTDRPMVWLQRLMFWCLGKLKAYSHINEPVYKTFEVDVENLCQAINIQLDVLSMYGPNTPWVRVMMGPKQYRELMYSHDLRAHVVLANPSHARDSRGNIYGLEIEVVPWMDGVLVMPKSPAPLLTPGTRR